MDVTNKYVKIMLGIPCDKRSSNLVQNKINDTTNKFSNTALVTFSNLESSTDTESVCSKRIFQR